MCLYVYLMALKSIVRISACCLSWLETQSGYTWNFLNLPHKSVSITFSMPVGSANWLITLDNNNIYNILMQRRVYIVFPTSRSQKNLCISDQIRIQCLAFYFAALISLFPCNMWSESFYFPFLFFFFLFESSTDCGNSFRFSMLWPAVI